MHACNWSGSAHSYDGEREREERDRQADIIKCPVNELQLKFVRSSWCDFWAQHGRGTSQIFCISQDWNVNYIGICWWPLDPILLWHSIMLSIPLCRDLWVLHYSMFILGGGRGAPFLPPSYLSLIAMIFRLAVCMFNSQTILSFTLHTGRNISPSHTCTSVEPFPKYMYMYMYILTIHPYIVSYVHTS